MGSEQAKTMEEKARLSPKRIALYVMFDKDGILDGFRRYYLQELRKVTERIVVVVNGMLVPESYKELEQLADDFFVRENTGLRAYGWIEGIKYIGWDKLGEYDELLMLDDSVFGPFYPLRELLDAAERSDADFYGAMKCFEEKKVTELAGHKFKHGHLRGAIRYFYIIKNRLLHSAEFKAYWSASPEINDEWDASFFCEYDFFDYVKDAGFRIDAYQDDSLKGYAFDNTTHNACKLIRDNRIPFAQIRPFGTDIKNESLQVHYGKDPREALEYIDKHTDYDVNLIWDHILRTKNLREIWEQLQLEYIVPKDTLERAYTYEKRIAVILHIYYEDLVEQIADYCANFPEKTDFYVTTTTAETKNTIDAAFTKRELHYECTIRPNVGVAMSSLWITYASVVTDVAYEYIFYFHDKKSNYWDYAIEGEQFGQRCYENLAGSEAIIKNIINLFEDNKRLGIIAPPDIYHGHYFNTPQTTWEENFDNAAQLADKLGIKVDIRRSIAPVAPYGDMFWFRASALKKAIGYGFTYNDFDIKYSPDGTILHALERIYGYAAQDSGYYYASVISLDNARGDLVNYQHMIYDLCNIVERSGIRARTFESARGIILSVCGDPKGQAMAFLVVKNEIKKHIPKPIWSMIKKVYHLFGGKKWTG